MPSLRECPKKVTVQGELHSANSSEEITKSRKVLKLFSSMHVLAVAKDLSHQATECGWSIYQPERHHS